MHDLTQTDDGNYEGWRIAVIIPALNEEESIGKVLMDIPPVLNAFVLVVDNGSTDQTAERARLGGAHIILQNERGYGNACLAGLNFLIEQKEFISDGIVVFLDADYSDHPEEMKVLLQPIIHQKTDLVIGSRVLGNHEKGSLQPQQRFGNWLAAKLIYWKYGFRYTDLGPFRAIRMDKLLALKMEDRDFGWTVEMQIKAVKNRLRIAEVPVSYRIAVCRFKQRGLPHEGHDPCRRTLRFDRT